MKYDIFRWKFFMPFYSYTSSHSLHFARWLQMGGGDFEFQILLKNK